MHTYFNDMPTTVLHLEVFLMVAEDPTSLLYLFRSHLMIVLIYLVDLHLGWIDTLSGFPGNHAVIPLCHTWSSAGA